MSSASGAGARFTLVLPVQSAARAKSRLVAPAGVDHATLARAIATDALAAVRACDRVVRRVVVTSDPVIGPAARALGDEVVADPGSGLTAAVTAGAARARRLDPDGAVGALLVDLPALTADDLALALDAAAVHSRSVVADTEGTGTVLLTALAGVELRHAFGTGSAARHAALGAVALDLDLPRLRRDVDTAAALRVATALGLGPRTAAVLHDALCAETFAMTPR